MSGEVITAGHLGGYVEGGDEATYYPELWDWLVDEYGVSSVIDVGCGDGVTVKHYRDRNIPVLGVDGWVPPPNPLFLVEHDFTQGLLEDWAPFDLCWSCEFVEHVEARYVPNFLPTFQQAPLVLMTHAFPGQQGYHHVNCQLPEYWKGVMAGIGYSCDEELTVQTRTLAAANLSPWNHYVRSGLAFRRTA